MNEDKARKELDRANRARLLLENELFSDAIEAIKDRLWKDFTSSELSDDDTRRNARIGVEMLNWILKALRKHMETGKLAERQLAKLEQDLRR